MHAGQRPGGRDQVCVRAGVMACHSRGESLGGSVPSADAAVSKLYPMADLPPEWRSREQLEPSPPSTSPAYWDTDDDDDSNSSCMNGMHRAVPFSGYCVLSIKAFCLLEWWSWFGPCMTRVLRGHIRSRAPLSRAPRSL